MDIKEQLRRALDPAQAYNMTVNEIARLCEGALDEITVLEGRLPKERAPHEPDIANQFGIGVSRFGASVRVQFSVAPTRLTGDEALVLAAWLVAVAQPMASCDFDEVYKRVIQS
jgi:hypothetical protein